MAARSRPALGAGHAPTGRAEGDGRPSDTPDTSAVPRNNAMKARIGDPLARVGQPQPIVLPQPTTLFAHRAARLESRADGHPMAAWLRFVAAIAKVQQALADRPGHIMLGVPDVMPDGSPPLATDAVMPGRDFVRQFRDFLSKLSDVPMPGAARAVLDELRTQDPHRLARACLAGSLRGREVGAAVFVAAVLQVAFACHAAGLDAASLHLLPQRSLCLVCGSTPVAGMITAAGPVPGTRYLHCGLCATAWNHARAVCTGCGESGGLVLKAIEDATVVKAETCAACYGYAKLLYQEQDMQVEPLADDLASLDLDLLLAEAGFARIGRNPLMVIAQ